MDKKIYFFKWGNLKIKAYDLVPYDTKNQRMEKNQNDKK